MLRVSAKGALVNALGLLSIVASLSFGIDVNYYYLLFLLPSIALFVYGFALIMKSVGQNIKELIRAGYPDEDIAKMIVSAMNQKSLNKGLSNQKSEYNDMLEYAKKLRHDLGDIKPKPYDQIKNKTKGSPLLFTAWIIFVSSLNLDVYLYNSGIIPGHYVFYLSALFLFIALVLSFTNKESLSDLRNDKLFDKNDDWDIFNKKRQ